MPTASLNDALHSAGIETADLVGQKHPYVVWVIERRLVAAGYQNAPIGSPAGRRRACVRRQSTTSPDATTLVQAHPTRMLDLVAEIDALIANGEHGKREAEIRIAAAKLPLDERLWLLRCVRAAARQRPQPDGRARETPPAPGA